MNKLFSRTMSGVLLVGLVILLTMIGNEFLLAAVCIISMVASYEFYISMKKLGYRYPIFLQMIYGVILSFLMYYDMKDLVLLSISMMLIILLTLVSLGNKYKLEDMSIMLFSIIYINFLFSIFLLFKSVDYIILIYCCAWGTDTFAYIFGMLFGKHKLIERLSPGKSIEGAIGGGVGSVITTNIILYLLGYQFSIIWSIFAIIGSVVSQIGDLSASYIKRKAKIKDYGKVIVGHGGVLDRFDSILYVIPVVYLLSLL